MTVPPILELYVVWHPDDDQGEWLSRALYDHFHQATYAGLAGGAVEVYVRSAAWDGADGPPRPIPVVTPLPHDLPAAEFTAVIILQGVGLARAVEQDPRWRTYVETLAALDGGRQKVSVFPIRPANLGSTGRLNDLIGGKQAILLGEEPEAATVSRDLAQSLAQRITAYAHGSEATRITVFVSHTKSLSLDEEDSDGQSLVANVRRRIDETHLNTFFDAQDLQPGTDWTAHLAHAASQSALLIVRTDRYASREWTQREVAIAKQYDVPVVTLHALHSGEGRGSFLMDHVPVLPYSNETPDLSIDAALNALVDQALKATLWSAQRIYLESNGFDWLPTLAPEPITLLNWLHERQDAMPRRRSIAVIHPDPPLGVEELSALTRLVKLAGYPGGINVLTPRTFQERGELLHP